MVKKFSDEEFDAFLQKEFLHEAEVVESALFSDEDFEEIELSDEKVEASYQQLIKKLKRDGVYREENDKKIFCIEKAGNGSKKRHPHSLARAAGFVVICVLGIFAASMTSEANRKYFIESLRYVAGDDTRVVINNDEADAANRDEYEAIDKIEQELGVKMPEFHFRPSHFEYYNSEVIKDAGIARMEYRYGDTIISVVVDKNSEAKASANIGLNGKKCETLTIMSDDGSIEVDLIESQDEQDTVKTYTAQWKFQEAFYQIDGKIKKSELEKMIQYIKF